jgi:hypothetical protein
MAARIKVNQVDSAWQRALDAAALAYSAQPVKQLDGSTLALCWSARVSRGIDKLMEAKRAGDDTTKLQGAIDALSATAMQAMRAAQTAAEQWAASARAVGQDVDPLAPYPPECQCTGCTTFRQRQAVAIARAELQVALAFLLAGDGNAPRLLGYMAGAGDATQRDLLWKALKNIADAMAAYQGAADAAGEPVTWPEVRA